MTLLDSLHYTKCPKILITKIVIVKPPNEAFSDLFEQYRKGKPKLLHSVTIGFLG